MGGKELVNESGIYMPGVIKYWQLVGLVQCQLFPSFCKFATVWNWRVKEDCVLHTSSQTSLTVVWGSVVIELYVPESRGCSPVFLTLHPVCSPVPGKIGLFLKYLLNGGMDPGVVQYPISSPLQRTTVKFSCIFLSSLVNVCKMC